MTDLRSRSELTGSPRARRGAHRPAPSRTSALVPVLLVLGAVAVLAAGVWLVTGLGGRGTDVVAGSASVVTSPASADTAGDTAGDPAATPSAEGAPGADPSSEASDAPASETPPPPAASTTATTTTAPAPAPAPASPPPSPGPTAEVDTDVPVIVLNATRTQGLAASTARDLEREGWTVASTGNERSGDVEATVVRYPDSDLEATAAAVAASLGDDVEAVLDDDAEGGSVTVVAGADQVG